VTDQNVRTDSDQLPADKHHDEVVREHDPEHRKHEQGKPAEVARTPLVIPHVANRINVDQESDTTDYQEHQFG
jgi:hypothetical protein